MNQEQSPRPFSVGDESDHRDEARWWRTRSVAAEQRPAWRRVTLCLAVAGCAVLLSYQGLRLGLIGVLGESPNAATLRRALALDPANPNLHHRVGMILAATLSVEGRAEGVRHLRRATELNPLDARFWADLGGACEMAEDTDCATRAVHEAVLRSPMNPQWHWAAGNTLLRAGQTNAALAEFRRLLELAPRYAPAVFHVCLGTLDDARLIRERVLPAPRDVQINLAYVNFLAAQGQTGAARQVWTETVAAGTRFPLAWTTPYLEHLLESGRAEEARSAWLDLESLGVVVKPPDGDPDNQLFNGDFEQTPLGGGLDWRYRESPYLALDFSAGPAHSGARCLRMDFTTPRNEAFEPVFQWVPVKPSQAYQLTAYVRSQDITSDSGPRLQVEDQAHPETFRALSESTVGTTPWHEVKVDFCTGPGTSLVRVSVVRERSRTFPAEITGSFFLDTVVLKSGGPANELACAGRG